jgi:hypothetical protein
MGRAGPVTEDDGDGDEDDGEASRDGEEESLPLPKSFIITSKIWFLVLPARKRGLLGF